jgi:carboxypeptidase family protein/TonB-dependent receptor-like protein
METLRNAAITLALILVAGPAAAQTTTGNISGLITDVQKAALRGVAVRVRNTETGFTRSGTSDDAGVYRLAGLPVGTYEVGAELQGMRPFVLPGVVVKIGLDVSLDITMQVADRAESVTVTAPAPMISTASSAVGEVVDLERIEGLPLNGRQFANLAATVPGVGLGLHTDSTKTAQYTPQISGGNGRNVNYVVDGGDNTDDTVGGLLQMFPLEAIQEFTVLTQRFDAEYGRSNGAVLNVVTKSGTNQLRASWFTLLRDDGMNARTFSETLANLDKQSYQRYQFGGSLGGPIVRDRANYFGAYERTNQDTKQIVNTLGAFPAEDGVFDVPFREDLFTGKVTASIGSQQYLSVRYGRDHNTQASGAGPTIAHSAWATSTNSFDSVNVNHNWPVRSSLLNEAVFQYSDFVNDTPALSPGPSFLMPSSVRGGTPATAPQRTEQIKLQFRNDLSWTTRAGFGVSHELRGGVNWIHEPRLRVFAGSGTQGLYTMAELNLTGPVIDVTVIGNNPTANFPLEQYGFYVQDNWRVWNRVTLNLGVRWDYVDGFPIDQSRSANFQAMQLAGASGRFAGTLLDEFGKEPRPDRDNVQPRFGAVIDLFGNARDVVRGGWGLYTDFGYIASNVLTAAFDAAQAGIVFQANDPQGLRKADETFFRVTDSLDTIAFRNAITGGSAPAGEVASPLLEQPYSRQTNLGWSHQLDSSTVVSADYVRVDGRDLNMRVRPNVRINGPQRLLTGLNISPNNSTFRTALSRGSSRYDGLILAFRRRLSRGVDASASYTVAKATSDVGTAYDEIAQNLIQDIRDPFGPVQQGPSARTDSRHLVSISGIIHAPLNVNVAPIFYYRSALPVHTFEGTDLNGDGTINDRTAHQYRYTGFDADNHATFEEGGACTTVVCSRRAGFSQLNLRVSRVFPLRRFRIEAIGEVFNLFNAKNPSFALTQARLLPTGAPNTRFMQPTAYAGDVGQPEQMVGQVGFRVTF